MQFGIYDDGVSSAVRSVETKSLSGAAHADDPDGGVEESFEYGNDARCSVRHLTRDDLNPGIRKAGIGSILPESLFERFDIVDHPLRWIALYFNTKPIRCVGKRARPGAQHGRVNHRLTWVEVVTMEKVGKVPASSCAHHT